MGNVTDRVRQALAALGRDAPDRDIKTWIRARDRTVPEGKISLAIRKHRGKMLRETERLRRKNESHPEPPAGDC